MWGGCGHDCINQDRGQWLRVKNTIRLRLDIVLKSGRFFVVVIIIN